MLFFWAILEGKSQVLCLCCFSFDQSYLEMSLACLIRHLVEYPLGQEQQTWIIWKPKKEPKTKENAQNYKLFLLFLFRLPENFILPWAGPPPPKKNKNKTETHSPSPPAV